MIGAADLREEPAQYYCDQSAGACSPRACSAGSHACNGEVYGACNAEGSGYTDDPVDCAAAKSLCTASGCATSVIEEVGEWPPTGGYGGIGPGINPTLFGNVLDVTQSRKLTKIAMHLTVAETTQLTWEVYEYDNGRYRSISRTVTTQVATNGFAEPGALNVTLLAGHTYAIGVVLPTPITDSSYVSVHCEDRTMSFANPATYFVLVGAPTSPDEFTLQDPLSPCNYRQRLTVAAP